MRMTVVYLWSQLSPTGPGSEGQFPICRGTSCTKKNKQIHKQINALYIAREWEKIRDRTAISAWELD